MIYKFHALFKNNAVLDLGTQTGVSKLTSSANTVGSTYYRLWMHIILGK